MNQDHINFLSQYKFKKIAAYVNEDSSPVVKRYTKHTYQPIVYTLFVEGVCMYIGKSMPGTVRPLSYLSNKRMHRVRNGIISSIDQGKDVEIYIKTSKLTRKSEGRVINIAEGFEQSLIAEFDPAWNRYKHKA